MDKVSFFPVGNGDSVLMEIDNQTIMTDIHYRAKCEDESEDEYYNFRDDLKEACKNDDEYRLNYFISTHPDRDHVLGFSEVFHTGDPDKYLGSSETILIEEIWVSPYGADPNYTTSDSEPLVDEIERRKKLLGTDKADVPGNRLRILSKDDSDNNAGSIGDRLSWVLLAPTNDEANIEKSDDEEKPNSCNNSSLVIRWKYVNGNKTEYILLGGDSDRLIWERVRGDFSDAELQWSVLLAPHHCSRCSMQFKNEDGKYEDSDNAISALSNVYGKGFVVASSKKVKKNDDNPPSWDAKQKYLSILKESHEENHQDRFLNPQTYGDGEKPKPVVFNLSAEKGLVINRADKSNSKTTKHSVAAAATPATYGSE